MLEGSAAALTHWAGEKRTDRSAQSHPLASAAAQDSAGANAPFRKEHPQQVRTLRVRYQRQADHTFAFMSFGKGFLRVSRAQDKSVGNNGEMGEEGERGKSGNGVDFWDLENPTMAKEEDRTEG